MAAHQPRADDPRHPAKDRVDAAFFLSPRPHSSVGLAQRLRVGHQRDDRDSWLAPHLWEKTRPDDGGIARHRYARHAEAEAPVPDVLAGLMLLLALFYGCKLIFIGEFSRGARASTRRPGLIRRLAKTGFLYGVFRWMRRRDERRDVPQNRSGTPPATGDASLPPPLRRRPPP